MKLIYSFSLNRYSYDCAKCNGLCCNICGSLAISKRQLYSEDFKPFWDYCQKVGCNFVIYLPKKCWFLINNKCKLGDNKPLSCLLYPIELYKLYNQFTIAEINPCPNIENGGTNGINSNDTLVDYYDNQFGIVNHYMCNMIDIPYEYDLNARVLTREQRIRFYSAEQDIILSLFSQLIFYPPLLLLDDDELCKVYSYYIKKYDEIVHEFDNYSTLYTYLKSKCIKFTLREFYVPVDNNNFSFELYFRDHNTKWRRK